MPECSKCAKPLEGKWKSSFTQVNVDLGVLDGWFFSRKPMYAWAYCQACFMDAVKKACNFDESQKVIADLKQRTAMLDKSEGLAKKHISELEAQLRTQKENVRLLTGQRNKLRQIVEGYEKKTQPSWSESAWKDSEHRPFEDQEFHKMRAQCDKLRKDYERSLEAETVLKKKVTHLESEQKKFVSARDKAIHEAKKKCQKLELQAKERLMKVEQEAKDIQQKTYLELEILRAQLKQLKNKREAPDHTSMDEVLEMLREYINRVPERAKEVVSKKFLSREELKKELELEMKQVYDRFKQRITEQISQQVRGLQKQKQSELQRLQKLHRKSEEEMKSSGLLSPTEIAQSLRIMKAKIQSFRDEIQQLDWHYEPAKQAEGPP